MEQLLKIGAKKGSITCTDYSVCRQKETGIKKFQFPFEILGRVPLITYLSPSHK